MATTKKAAAAKKAAKKPAKKAAPSRRAQFPDADCKTCGDRHWVAREGALETEYLQEDGTWESGPVPADRVPCPDCSSGFYPTVDY